MVHSKTVDRAALIADARRFLEQCHSLKEAGLINKNGDFFPSVHYPPITMYRSTTQTELFHGYQLPQDRLFDVYAHIPFCQQRCLFCHYPVKLGESGGDKDDYLDALKKEMDLYLQLLGVKQAKARSILVGGGTPTFLTLAQLERFLAFFVKRLDMSRCEQFNYDVDPNTLIGSDGRERLRILRDFGVDRLTIGVQSLDDQTLANMNRHHTAAQALEAIEESRKLGFKLNVEFIFGYPGQTLASWLNDMEMAMSLDVDEIQLFRLKVDAYGDYQGPIRDLLEKRSMNALDDVETLTMKKTAIDLLISHGSRENIRRVFSRTTKDYSRYAWNQCCLLYDQIGFGLTAFSSLRDRFALNTQSFDEYYAMIAAGNLPVNRGLVRDKEEQMRWAMILPLKNSFVLKNRFQEATGESIEFFRNTIDKLKQFGLLVEDDLKVQTTQLGTFFADEVAHQFHHPEFIPFSCDDYAPGPLSPYCRQEGQATQTRHDRRTAYL